MGENLEFCHWCGGAMYVGYSAWPHSCDKKARGAEVSCDHSVSSEQVCEACGETAEGKLQEILDKLNEEREAHAKTRVDLEREVRAVKDLDTRLLTAAADLRATRAELEAERKAARVDASVAEAAFAEAARLRKAADTFRAYLEPAIHAVRTREFSDSWRLAWSENAQKALDANPREASPPAAPQPEPAAAEWLRDWLRRRRGSVSGPLWCPKCGEGVAGDENGCCTACGSPNIYPDVLDALRARLRADLGAPQPECDGSGSQGVPRGKTEVVCGVCGTTFPRSLREIPRHRRPQSVAPPQPGAIPPQPAQETAAQERCPIHGRLPNYRPEDCVMHWPGTPPPPRPDLTSAELAFLRAFAGALVTVFDVLGSAPEAVLAAIAARQLPPARDT